MNKNNVKVQYEIIKQALDIYKEKVDIVAKTYNDRAEALHNEYMKAKTSGHYSDSYLSEMANKKPEVTDLLGELKNARVKVSAICSEEISKYKELLARYFEAPIKPEFSNTVQALKLVGDKPNRAEIDLLKRSAEGCYMAEKLLQSFADNITMTEQKVIVNGLGEAEYSTVETKAPIIFTIPDIEASYRAVAEIENTVNNTINRYPGADGELIDIMCTDAQDGTEKAIFLASGTSFFNMATQTQLTNRISQVEEIADKVGDNEETYKPKKNFTEADKHFIDSIVSPSYPTLAKSTIKDIAEYGDKSIIGLFLADSRYSDIMSEALTNNA